MRVASGVNVAGSNAIPHLGHAPGPSCRTSAVHPAGVLDTGVLWRKRLLLRRMPHSLEARSQLPAGVLLRISLEFFHAAVAAEVSRMLTRRLSSG